jgi:tRNA G46 methylase TrmB
VAVLQAINKIAEAMQVLGLAQPPAPQQQQSELTALNGLQQRQQQEQQQEQIQQHLQELQVTPSAQTNGAAHQQQQLKRWAIDVGAAPGGWTSYLADCCGYNVIAIDPAELHPDVAARPGVHHIRAKAADAMERVEQLLQGQQVGPLGVCLWLLSSL